MPAQEATARQAHCGFDTGQWTVKRLIHLRFSSLIAGTHEVFGLDTALPAGSISSRTLLTAALAGLAYLTRQVADDSTDNFQCLAKSLFANCQR